MRRILFIILATLFMLTGCKKNMKPTTKIDFVLDTVSSISIYDMPEKKAVDIIDGAFELCREYERIFSKTISNSEIHRINNSAGEWTEVSNETIELIDIALKYSEISEGKFDITIAPVEELWNFTGENNFVPEKSKIEEAVKHVDYRTIEIEGKKIRILDSEAAIDLGGIAKGYIADILKEFLIENGVEKAIISLGGNVLTVGPNDGTEFSVGIQKPFGQSGVSIAKVDVKDMSVVTSGTYQRYFEEDGKIYHHILDSKTGYPIDTGILSVTVISPSSVTADVLSTTCFVLGKDEGMDIIENTQNTEAIFILNDYSIVCSSGINDTTSFEMLNLN